MLICSNSKITKTYVITYNSLGGEAIKGVATTRSIPCWYEDVRSYIRGVDGDIWNITPTLIVDLTTITFSLIEGQVIELTKDNVAKDYRIETIVQLTGLPFVTGNKPQTAEITLSNFS